jgi:Domain of unknown function (DUF5668)
MGANSADLIRAIRGPVLLIVLGLLFVGDYFGPYPFYKTWPVLLIAYGLLKLVERVLPQGGAQVGGSV